jgi:hypothetical protein
MNQEELGRNQTVEAVNAGTEVLETSASGQAVENAEGCPAAVTALSRETAALDRRGVNLKPDAALRHGIGPLTQRGELPAASEFDLFREALEDRRREARAWVGGEQASVFDLDAVEAYARWATAHDVVWGVLFAEGIFTRTRRRKSLIELAERIDKRASYHRELCRSRRQMKTVGEMSLAEYVEHERQQHAQQRDGQQQQP